MASRPLTARQARFVPEYLVDLNGTKAAERAGFAPKGAAVTAAKLLRNPKVRAAIDEALKRRSDRVEVKADDVLRELLRLAMVDIGDAFDEHGALKPLKHIPADVRRAIAGIDVVELPDEVGGVIRKVKFWDKKGALELLGKHLKLFTDKIELSADSSFAAALQAARDRALSR